ncbi:MAG: 1,2-phenylacetyl-CoA epoxidase subunit PaaE [Paracoccaceae bacterium]
MAPRFHSLEIGAVTRETPDAVSLAFKVPPELAPDFAFRPGQYLTLRAEIDGEDLRRSYSICAAPGEALRVGVKRIDGGRFSGFATALKPGDRLEVMPPEGRFGVAPGGRHDYLLVGAGSGITPLLSIARAVLAEEPESRVTLLYGNRDSGSIMFLEELEDLKDRHLDRFRLVHLLSRESQDVELLHGRLDAERLRTLARTGLIRPAEADGIFLCGPGDMTDAAAEALQALGAPAGRIHFERFTPAADAPPPKPASDAARQAAEEGATVSTILDGARRSFPLRGEGETVLEAAHKAGLELPYSCAGGMCCTCRCRVVEGEAEMAVNYSLEPWEVEAGFILACQARPRTRELTLDFDAV